MAITHLYWFIEVFEIITEIKKNGLLDIEERNAQKQTMQLLYWGAAVAIFIWGLLWARGDGGPSYGWIEWLIIIHTLVLAKLSIEVIYPLIDNYLQSTSAQRRVERTDETEH